MNWRLICYLALALLFSTCVIAKSASFLRYSDSTKSSSDGVRSYQIDIDAKFDHEKAIARAIANPSATKSEASNQYRFHRRRRYDDGSNGIARKKMINIFTIPDFTTSAQIKYIGRNSKVILVVTSRRNMLGYVTTSNFYRSVDNGATFVRSIFFEDIIISRWYFNERNPGQLIIRDGRNGRRIYISADLGKTFTVKTLDFAPATFVYCPNSQNASYVASYDAIRRKLYVSSNASADWNLVDDRAIRFYWSPSEIEHHTHRIYYERLTPNNSTVTIHYYDLESKKKGVFDPKMPPSLPRHLIIFKKYMMTLTNGKIANGSHYDLHVSHDRGSFEMAQFPLSLANRRFHIVTTKSAEVIISVNHQSNLSNLYISDESGKYYTLAISDIFAASDLIASLGYSFFAFDTIVSMPGTYIVSKVTESSDNPFIRPRVSSMITFNKGGSWHRLRPPSVDRFGKPIDCQDPCSLHINVLTGDFRAEADLYSDTSAPGLVIGIGNYGDELSASINKAIYISSDGGYSWIQASPNYRIYTALNHGSIILASGKGIQRNAVNVSYSCNSGQTFTDIQVANLTLNTLHLSPSQPDGNSLVAMLFSHDIVSGWVFASMYLRPIVPRQCDNNDYFTWSPADPYDTEKCLLGARYSYQMRKSDSCCYNPDNYLRHTVTKPCPCTPEDFQCNYGFEIQTDGTCAAIRIDRDSCINGSTFSTIPYRKTPGNICQGGIEQQYLAGRTYWCKSLIEKSDAGLIYSLAIGVPVVILIVAILVYIKIRRKRNRIYYDSDPGLIVPTKLDDKAEN